ncbi:MAG: cysteine hydrolase [Deltaproteobacteria bacterium]|nr:cysteine hydrolase [Deltaproteobacteria bacterium]
MLKELNLTEAALLVVDLQEDFLAARGGLKDLGLQPIQQDERATLLINCQRLLTEARRNKRPVIYAQTAFRADLGDCFLPPKWLRQLRVLSSVLIEGTSGTAIPKEIAPQADDYVITKKSLSAFQFTHLDRLLSNLGVDTCILVGFCGVPGSIDDTTRMAGLLGYDTVIAADAVFPIRTPHLATFVKRAAVGETHEIVSRLQAAGPRREKVEALRPAMIIVAMNNDGHHPQGSKHRYGIDSSGSGPTDEERELFIRNNNRLIEVMTGKGFPVIHAQTAVRLDQTDDAHSFQAFRVTVPEWKKKFPPGVGYMIEDTWGAEILEGVRLPEGYYRVCKKGNSAFGLTHMHRLLRNLGVNFCIITGDATTGCVSDTVREGVGLGYESIVVSDATSRANIPYHQVLANRAEVKSTDEVLAWLEKLQPSSGTLFTSRGTTT